MSFSIYSITSLLIILIGSNLAFCEDNHSQHKDAPSVHGMLVFGKEKVYLSHLPMFHSPHDYQVLLEVELPIEVKTTYLIEKEQDKFQSVYTIVPESFILSEVMGNGKSFKAVLYKGHFERGGFPITKKFKIGIKKVLYFKKFEKNALKSEMGKYIIIGNIAEQFLVHKVIAKPDFDQISKLSGLSKTITTILLDTTHLDITIPDNLNTIPVEENKEFSGYLSNNQSISLILQTKKQIYLEFADLSF